MEGTMFTPALKALQHVKSEEGAMLTMPFLHLCKMVLSGLDEYGNCMAFVRADIGINIAKVEKKYSSDPSKYNHLYSMVKEEVEADNARDSSSSGSGLLWLTRTMDFLVGMYRNLLENPYLKMSQACSEAYEEILRPFHGWLEISGFKLASAIAPERKKFMESVAGSGDINSDMQKFCDQLSPLLEENHKFLASLGLDDMKSQNWTSS